MKKIAIVIAECTIGGIETSLINMLAEFDYTKYEITLFTNIRNNTLALQIPESVRKQIRIIDTDNYGARDLFKRYTKKGKLRLSVRLLANYIKSKRIKSETVRIELLSKGFLITDEEYDCAIAYKMGYKSTSIALYQIPSKLKIFWVHGLLTNAPNYDQTYLKWIRKYDHLFGVSNATVDQTIRVCPEVENRITTFLNILDENSIKQLAGLFEDEAKSDMQEDGRIRILSIGRFTDEKNFTSIPFICRRLKENGVRFHWFIIGYGREEEQIREEIQKENVKECCTILGQRNNPYPYLDNCDVYIQPSRVEGKSVAVIEAQIFHKPVIITNYPTSSDQLHDGVDGLIVPMEREACAEAIANILKDRELLQKIAEGTKKFDYCNKDEIKKLYALIED